MKKTIAVTLSAVILILMAACGAGKLDPPIAPYVPSSQAPVAPSPSINVTPEGAVEEEPQATESPISVEVLGRAATYRDMYLDISQNDTIGVNLTSAQMEGVVSHFEAAGLTVKGITEDTAMRNTKAVDDYFAATRQGNSAELVIYEICLDGGFIQHRISNTNAVNRITLTRLAWEKCEPVVTYSKEYEITKLEFMGGTLTYEYFMPDNPEGTNHDGHIDTVKTFKVY